MKDILEKMIIKNPRNDFERGFREGIREAISQIDETRIVRPSIEKTREAAEKAINQTECRIAELYDDPDFGVCDLVHIAKDELIRLMLDAGQSCQGHQCPDQTTDTRKFTKEEMLDAFKCGHDNLADGYSGKDMLYAEEWFNQKYGE